jgi:hypothetical protein
MGNADSRVPEVSGAEAVAAWFGEWPSFHDAEVIALHLERDGPSFLKIRTWLMTGETEKRDGKRFYRTHKHATVTFELLEIMDLELAGFSSQNVIFVLRIDRESEFFRLTLSPCYGMAGHIDAKTINVTVAPAAVSEVSNR